MDRPSETNPALVRVPVNIHLLIWPCVLLHSLLCWSPYISRSPHFHNRGKKPLDAANSKFIQLEPYSKSNPSIPAHMRPVGENKGTCKSVELLDQANFRITLWSGKVFEAKVVGESTAQISEKTADWVKVINSFQRRP